MRWTLVLVGLAMIAHADIAVNLTANGEVQSVAVGGKQVAGAIGLYVPKPGWQGNWFTSDGLNTPQGTASGATQVIRGTAGPADQPVADVAVHCTTKGQLVELVYEFTPRETLAAQDTLVRIHLPIQSLAGQPYLLLNSAASREGRFPQELPTPYTFFHDAGFDQFAWPVGEDTYLALEPDWQCFSGVNVQDDRYFKGPDYEIQLYLLHGRDLRQGKTMQARLVLREVSGKELRARIESQLAPRRRLYEALSQRGEPAIQSVIASATSVPVYGRLELTVGLTATYDNPFDPEDVRLDAVITDPDGQETTVPGFFSCPYQRNLVGTKSERLVPVDGAGWRVRFSPRKPGNYRGRVVLTDGDQKAESPFAFTATPAAHHGLVRVAKANPLAFEFEDGSPYFAIGENVCWPSSAGTYDYDNYWRRLAEAGANYARIWVGPFDCFTLERVKRDTDDHAGLGRIDLEDAWRLDYVLDEAAKRGIEVMFCIDSFNSLRIKEPHAIWSRCPYSQANGGPLAKPQEFFTNAEARKLFERRLRYIVARWGDNPYVMSWEFWNEVDIIETYVSDEVRDWHRDMARYLRDLDPYDHLITTSWARTAGDPNVDALPELDYIQSHQYGAHDAAWYLMKVSREKNATFGKPHYFGEFGTGTRAEGTREDVDGIHLHNGLWSGVFAPAAGTGMLWWWDNYVEPRDLYHLFTPVAKFVQGIPYNTVRYAPLADLQVAWRGTPPPPRREDLLVQGRHLSWSPAPFNQPRTVVCQRDGKVEGIDQLARLQHGLKNHPDLHNPVTFQVDYVVAGRFVVKVGNVSGYGGAGLRIALDGETKLEKLFPDEDDSNQDITAFAGNYAIEVPAGPHAVVVENVGRDWVYLDYILPDYTVRTDPPVVLYALSAPSARPGEPTVLLWARHEAFTWYRHSLGMSEWPVGETEVAVAGVPAGSYRVELWDTFTGESRPGGSVKAGDGTVRLPLPAFAKDLAVKLFPETP